MSGTTRGQGRAATLWFAAEGAIVVGGGLRHESGLKTQRLVTKAGGAALTPGPLDATDEDSVRAWVEETADALRRIDILYANADAVRFGAVDTQPYEDFGCTMRAHHPPTERAGMRTVSVALAGEDHRGGAHGGGETGTSLANRPTRRKLTGP
jgi:NAD(P)-dependent dehydrogenase (short-subunit alcohol dehydrogenase family)